MCRQPEECGCCTPQRIRSLTQNHALHAFLSEESAMDWSLFDALWASDCTVTIAMRHWHEGQSGDADVARNAEAAALDLPHDTALRVRAVYKASMAFLIQNYGEHPVPESDWGERWSEVMSPEELESMRAGADRARSWP